MTLWLLDTSAVVPAVLTSHEAHAATLQALGRRTLRVPFHAAIESYSVLTRLPGDARLQPSDAERLLSTRFGVPIDAPAASGQQLLAEFASVGLAGGAVYDALIAITARAAGAVLLTRDRRAAATYAQLNAKHEFV